MFVVRRAGFSLLLGLLVSALGGCGVVDVNGAGEVVVTGVVVNGATGAPLSGAYVRLAQAERLFETDASGRYSATLRVDSATTMAVTATKDGFTTASQEVLAVGGKTVDVPTLTLSPVGEGTRTSGRPSNLLLLSQTASTIGVKESGAEEVMGLTFQVADSVGRPVVLAQGTSVRFLIGSGPGGGEFISPSDARTDNNGRVTANLSSGTRAGVVQVVAEMTVDGRTVRSQPVAVAIHGGLPSQDHFTLGAQTANLPGLIRAGLPSPITVIVGDKYANPVRPGTAVYFTTTHGIIGGSAMTDASGAGSVTLVSGNPLPPDGLVVVTGTTVDEMRRPVTARVPMVFSGATNLGVSPTSVALNQTYTVTLQDRNGNPLAAGTRLTIEAAGVNVRVLGGDITLGETVFVDGGRDTNGDGLSDAPSDGDVLDAADIRTGNGATRFSFSVVRADNAPTSEPPVLNGLLIKVSSANGDAELNLGSGGIASPTRGAHLERLGGRVLLRLAP